MQRRHTGNRNPQWNIITGGSSQNLKPKLRIEAMISRASALDATEEVPVVFRSVGFGESLFTDLGSCHQTGRGTRCRPSIDRLPCVRHNNGFWVISV